MKFTLTFLVFLTIVSCKITSQDRENNDDWVGENYSGFSNYKAVNGSNFMIATADKFSSKAGAEILEKGGNAVDAAIAAQMVLNVVEPQSSGIGGGVFLLYYDANTKNSLYFNGREIAPSQAHEKMFLDKKGKVRKFHDVVAGGLSVGTPGALKALKSAHEKYGKLPWKDLFTPAIKIASKGFKLDRKIHVILKQVPYLSRFEGMKIYFNKDGSPKKLGTIIKNPQLAQTFKTIANEGITAFYKGKIAQDIVKEVRESKANPGYLSLEDLENYRIKKGDLLCSTYRQKYKVCSMPLPSSGGVALLQMLGILENFDLSEMDPSSLETVHLISEATRLAYADRNEYVADVPNVPINQMLNKEYLRKRAGLISMTKALEEVKPGKFHTLLQPINKTLEKPSTTHIAIIDSDGNSVSMTSSIEYLFGSALAVDGFMLNNQLTDFSLAPEVNGKKVANRVRPGRQPRSSMSPTFVFDSNDNLIMSVGSPGGPRIIQYVLKTVVGHLDWGLDIQGAISLPNHVVLNSRVELEDRTSLKDLKAPLEKMGHKVVVTDITSGIQGVTIGEKGLTGGADPRRHGAAIGK